MTLYRQWFSLNDIIQFNMNDIIGSVLLIGRHYSVNVSHWTTLSVQCFSLDNTIQSVILIRRHYSVSASHSTTLSSQCFSLDDTIQSVLLIGQHYPVSASHSTTLSIQCFSLDNTIQSVLLIGRHYRVSASHWTTLSSQCFSLDDTIRSVTADTRWNSLTRVQNAEVRCWIRLDVDGLSPMINKKKSCTCPPAWSQKAFSRAQQGSLLHHAARKKKGEIHPTDYNTVMLSLRMCSFVLLVLGLQKAATAGNKS